MAMATNALGNTLRKFAGSEQADREISSELNGGPILTLKKSFSLLGLIVPSYSDIPI